jgi:hypothetical protein
MKLKGESKKPVIEEVMEKIRGGEKDKFPFYQFLSIITAGTIVSFIYIYLQSRALIKPGADVFFLAEDRYMDFFNLLCDAQKNVFIGLSPVWMAILHVVETFYPEALYPGSAAGKNIFFIYNVLNLVVFSAAFGLFAAHFRIKKGAALWLFLAFIFSYPVIFAFDRGNWALLTAGILAMFFSLYIRGNILIAAVFLGIAISLKFYPAIYILIFVANKKWHALVLSIVIGAALTLIPLAIFDGGLINNLSYMVREVLGYRVIGAMDRIIAFNSSVYAFFDTIKCMVQNLYYQPFIRFERYHYFVKMAAMSILFVASGLSLVPVIKNSDRFLLLTAGMVLFPMSSNDYMIPMAILPLLYWILSEPSDKVMPWLAGLLFICKRYIVLAARELSLTITIQSILNPLLFLALIGYIIWIRRDLLREFADYSKLRISSMLGGRR